MSTSTFFLPTFLVIVSVFCRLATAACPSDRNQPWSYNAQYKNGPEYWGETYPKCYGRRQSPVNIVTSNVRTDRNLKRLQLNNYDKPMTKSNIENNGHTVKVTPGDGVNRTVIVNGTAFSLSQLHFHWGDVYSKGSEHKVNDKQYALELHLVHADKRGRTAVVGVFYQDSIFNSSGLKPLIDSLKRIPYKDDNITLRTQINLDKLVKNGCSFYRYNGSLTTPGCDEGVIWSICKDPINLGTVQLREFRNLFSKKKNGNQNITDCKLRNNFRPTQPLNGRLIRSSV